jgi:lysophospholipase L1-like esterase
MTRFAALGDSITLGMGDPLPGGGWRGWAALRPDLASVVAGINDTLRGDFDPRRTGAAIGRTVAGLREAGAQVLTIRLPDPGQMSGLPGALARRMRAVNTVVDEVARRHGTLHLDVARDPATYERRYWSADRLHPNERGHRFIACRFHALLATSGFPVGPGPDPEPRTRAGASRAGAGEPERLKRTFRKLRASRAVALGSPQGAEPTIST